MLGLPQGEFSDIYAIGAVCYRAIGGTLVDALARQNSLAAGRPDPQPSAAADRCGTLPWTVAGGDRRGAGDRSDAAATERGRDAGSALAATSPTVKPTVVLPRRAAPATRARADADAARVGAAAAAAGALALAGAAYFAFWSPAPSRPPRQPPAVVAGSDPPAAPPPGAAAAAGTAHVPRSRRAPRGDSTGRFPTAPAAPPPACTADRWKSRSATRPWSAGCAADPRPCRQRRKRRRRWSRDGTRRRSLPCSVLRVAAAPDRAARLRSRACRTGTRSSAGGTAHAGRSPHRRHHPGRRDSPARRSRRWPRWSGGPGTARRRRFAIRLDRPKRGERRAARDRRRHDRCPRVYVDLYQARRIGASPAAAGAVGRGRHRPRAQWVATPPPGPRLVVAIGSATPLDLGARPDTERAADYLDVLQSRLRAGHGAAGRRSRDGDGACRRTGGIESAAGATNDIAVGSVCQYCQPRTTWGNIVRCGTRGAADRMPVLTVRPAAGRCCCVMVCRRDHGAARRLRADRSQRASTDRGGTGRAAPPPPPVQPVPFPGCRAERRQRGVLRRIRERLQAASARSW